MEHPLHIIHVEDSEDDCELIKRLLVRDGLDCEIRRVETRSQLVDSLAHTECDLVLADCTLPQFSGFQALEITSALKPQIPFIFVSGTIGEDAAIESLRNGATDYVLKDRLSRLVPAVRRALEETKEQEARRAWEKRLHQARRLQAASTLAGGVAHDVNKLFMKIREHVDLLAGEGGHSESTPEIIEKLRDIANEGSGLMQQLLAFARKSEAHLTWIDLPRYLHEEKTTLDLLLPKGMELRVHLEEDLPLLFADPEHLHRILVNLVLNARDAMPRGGQITLSAELIQFNPIPEPFMELEDVPYVCLKVADTGLGMNEATRHRVFEPFFTTKPLGEGTGLGLPEVFGLMRIHNGLVDIHSEPGKGTAVSLFFPLPRNSYSAPRQMKQLPPIPVPEVAAPL